MALNICLLIITYLHIFIFFSGDLSKRGQVQEPQIPMFLLRQSLVQRCETYAGTTQAGARSKEGCKEA